MPPPPEIRIGLPDWMATAVEWDRAYPDMADRMRLAIRLARLNVEHATGGPFGAAVFELESSRLVAVGVNLVTSAQNSTLHAEIVALMLAERRRGHYSLGTGDGPAHELVTSCDPCAMCLGAALWSGVRRIVAGADSAAARRVGFDEGPVFPESYEYLRARGIESVRGVLRAEAATVLEFYRAQGGEIYNG